MKCDFAIIKLKRRSEGYLEEEMVQTNVDRKSVAVKQQKLDDDEMEFE